MKITKSQLREIIKEEIEREVPKEGDKLELISEALTGAEFKVLEKIVKEVESHGHRIHKLEERLESLGQPEPGTSPGDDDRYVPPTRVPGPRTILDRPPFDPETH